MIVPANTTNDLPYVSIDEMNGVIDIKGRSISSEVNEFFEPIIEYLKNYLLYNQLDMVINIDLEYINTKSSRLLVNIFQLVKESTTINDNKLVINWYYDQEDGDLEAGKDYEDILGVKFNFIEN
jgi:hypothetical protein